MTVTVAETGAATAEAGAAEASAGARQTVRPRRASPRPRSRPDPAGPTAQGGSQRRGGNRSRPSGNGPDLTNYQAVILGEFVAAVLLVAATPFAKKDSPGVSPYAGSDLLQLVAITLVYFLLALISGANRGAGRFSAWFGALILLTVGLGEAARLAKLLNVFGLQSPPPQDLAPGPITAPGA